MVRTSTAAQNGYVCPACGDQLNRDPSGRGYVAHKRNRNCPFEKGERDPLDQWRQSANNDNGSLYTGQLRLDVGTVIEIRGENRQRNVTYTMGSDRNGWRACFKDQPQVPTGNIEWRIVSVPTATSAPAPAALPAAGK